MNIGENLKRLRKNSNLTQKELADILGVTTVTIQNYENNRRAPNSETLLKISKALNMPFSIFINEIYSTKKILCNLFTGCTEPLLKNYFSSNIENGDFTQEQIKDSLTKLVLNPMNKDMNYISPSSPEDLFDTISKFIDSSTCKNIDTKKITIEEKKEIITKIVDLFEFEVFKLNKK
ncbi:TPA: helix-turn-helix domain-containing protein [Clostridium perfringens]|uniref:helix-turn-helix domain-containing protein n=1 Tax=Clostridium perfringens TaxID=1502 RepID=UPI001CB197CB|nr:helix-turn-helix domain-containing protein [Clostridium perfringens]HBI6884199.1 helix-turn-helix domain-containing protein [Clostridium perfringens]HBI6902017.1 helix-turn-helix domain-containing protein [Clostridium perfringens]HBI6930996.1 helix-turn-helix domain-containing protein [Clostridium perfringens]HBI6941157.1 helix-turn-helix domain-containing protein [Clostridium perfringens]